MGWLMGLLGGLSEFALLRETVSSVLAGRTKRALIALLLNVFCLAGILALVLALWRSQLAACGIVMAGSLIASALVAFIIQRHAKKEGDIQ